MLRRVILAGVATFALALTFGISQSSNAQAQAVASSGNCPYWIDNDTGIRPPVGPRGYDPISSGTRFSYGGHNYHQQSDGTWIDNDTGTQPPVGPPGYDPISSGTRFSHGGHNYHLVPCPPPSTTTGVSGGVQVSVFIGTSSTSTSFVTTGSGSAGVGDPVTDNKVNPSGTGFVGGVGASAALGELTNPFSGATGGTNPITRYAPEAKNAYAAYFPLKAPPKPQTPRSMLTWGVDGNVYFFAGGDQTITGIPGGPFGTATGIDTFRISNNYMFTVGGWITAPITPTWSVSLTGGLAELNQTVTYNCVTFCAVAPATPAFTASQDRWVTGGYIGGRLAMPVALPGFPGANIGIDYKHVFFGNYNVSLGTVATRQVNARLSPDMDLVTLRLGVPIR